MTERRHTIRSRKYSGRLLGAAVLFAASQMAYAQGILGSNLIVNGNAEAGPAGSGVLTAVASIPGWTVQSGKPTVLPYNLTSTAAQQPTNGYEQLTDPRPSFMAFNISRPLSHRCLPYYLKSSMCRLHLP
jgi:hypothetical protein